MDIAAPPIRPDAAPRSAPKTAQTPDPSAEKPNEKPAEPENPKSRWPLILIAIVVVLAILAGALHWFLTRNLEDTDDAYTDGNAIAIAANVSGYVTNLAINDNTRVVAGQLLFRIDQRLFIAARDQARGNLALAQAQQTSAAINLQIARVRAPATLLQAEAQLAQARATAAQAAQDYARQHRLNPAATTQTNIDQSTAQLRSQSASVDFAAANEKIASLVQQTIGVAESQVNQSEAQVAQAQASLATAEINLSYTEVRAPQDGFVTSRNVDLGTYVQAGQQVFYLVAPRIWVVANFKENQLTRMKAGQHVSISVDAYPALKLRGHLDSIQDGSGARFSAFPAENATGNFVKIVRRVPVKIIIDSGLPAGHGLPLGLSVTPIVTVQ